MKAICILVLSTALLLCSDAFAASVKSAKSVTIRISVVIPAQRPADLPIEACARQAYTADTQSMECQGRHTMLLAERGGDLTTVRVTPI